LEDVAGYKSARIEDGVDELPDGAMAAVLGGHEAAGGDVGQDITRGIFWAGAEAGDLHGEEVIDVIAEEADVLQRDGDCGGELAECGGLVAAALGDVLDMQFFCVSIDQRGRFAGDEGEMQAEAAGERDAHDVGEGEGLRFGGGIGGIPGEFTVGEDAVYVEGDGLEGLQAIDAVVGIGHELDGGADATELLHDGDFVLVDALDAVAHGLLDEADIADEAADAVWLEGG